MPFTVASRRTSLAALRHRYHLQEEVAELRLLGAPQMVVLLDYETNRDLDDLSSPLSHASLIVRYLDASWPER